VDTGATPAGRVAGSRSELEMGQVANSARERVVSRSKEPALADRRSPVLQCCCLRIIPEIRRLYCVVNPVVHGDGGRPRLGPLPPVKTVLATVSQVWVVQMSVLG
jgi:hypothetical protein